MNLAHWPLLDHASACVAGKKHKKAWGRIVFKMTEYMSNLPRQNAAQFWQC